MSRSWSSLIATAATACMIYFVHLSVIVIVMPFVYDRIGSVTRAEMRAILLLITMRMLAFVQGPTFP